MPSALPVPCANATRKGCEQKAPQEASSNAHWCSSDAGANNSTCAGGLSPSARDSWNESMRANVGFSDDLWRRQERSPIT